MKIFTPKTATVSIVAVLTNLFLEIHILWPFWPNPFFEQVHIFTVAIMECGRFDQFPLTVGMGAKLHVNSHYRSLLQFT